MDIKVKMLKVGQERTNCYIAHLNTGEAFLVDPGDEAERIIAEVENIRNLKLKYILLTHAHFDHILAVDKLKEKYPDAEVIINEKDIPLLEGLVEQGLFIGRFFHNFRSEVTVLQDGDQLNFGEDRIEMIETPGHSEGSVSYLIDKVLFTGDTLFYHTYGRTDLPYSNQDDMRESLRKLLKMDDKTKVYPGHGKSTTIGEEKKLSCFYLG